MKKAILFLCLTLLSSGAAFAQDADREVGTTNRKGNYVLPKAGDIGLGVEVSPFLNLMGNMFNGSTGNDASGIFNGQDYSIRGKYFLRDNRALRFGVGFGFSSTTRKDLVPDQGKLVTNPEIIDPTVEDTWTQNTSTFAITAGYEFRRGYGRLQAFWGGQAGIGFKKTKHNYQYGNPMTELNPTPLTSDWSYPSSATSASNRMLWSKVHYTALGVGAFAGVEYFIAPKIAIGGELSLNFSYNWTGVTRFENERFDTNLGAVQKTEERSWGAAQSEVNLSTQPTGSLYVIFHF